MKMWEIRENTEKYDEDYRMGMKERSAKEAYKCGYEDGYEDAIEEMSKKESYRSSRKYR